MYHVYVQVQKGTLWGPFEEATEESAKALIEKSLNEYHAGEWKFEGQYVWNDGLPGDLVAAYYHEYDPEAEAREKAEHEQWLAELPEYGIYGKAGRERISSDAIILAGLVASVAELEENSDDLWKRFVAAGGDDGHSGASFWGVRCEAADIVKARLEAAS